MNQQNILHVSNRLPEVNRPDATMAEARVWRVLLQDNQHGEADAMIEKWIKNPSPEGLISRACYLGTDGFSLMEYSQWENLRVPEDSGTLNKDSEFYTLYRSDVQPTESEKKPGCIVAVNIELQDADTGLARQWVDGMFDSGFDSDSDSGKEITIPGLISAHFHISLDGKHVLNYAEWTDEEAHRKMMEGGSHDEKENVSEPSEQTEAPSAIKKFSVTRFCLYKSLNIS